MDPKNDSDLRDALRRLGRLPLHGEPLAKEEVLAYYLEALSEEEEEEIRERLIWDDDAQRYLFELMGSEELEAVAEERNEAEIAADWREIRRQLRENPNEQIDAKATEEPDARILAPPGEPVDPPDPTFEHATPTPALLPPWYRQVMPFQALAAGLLVLALALGLGWKLHGLRQQLDQESKPRADLLVAAISPLSPSSVTRNPAEAELRVPADVSKVVLLLTYAGFETFDSYRAELSVRPLVDQGKSAKTFDLHPLKRTPEGTFSLELSRGWLVPGIFEIKLFGVSPRGEPLLAEYLLSVAVEE